MDAALAHQAHRCERIYLFSRTSMRICLYFCIKVEKGFTRTVTVTVLVKANPRAYYTDSHTQAPTRWNYAVPRFGPQIMAAFQASNFARIFLDTSLGMVAKGPIDHQAHSNVPHNALVKQCIRPPIPCDHLVLAVFTFPWTCRCHVMCRSFFLGISIFVPSGH
jgi:hypothetical protein